MRSLSILIFSILFVITYLSVVIDARSVLVSHTNPSDVKRFESKLDTNIGYWSPSTSSIDWCERNYVVTQYIAEFWNCLSSFGMCISAGILIVHGLYNRIEKRFLLLSLSFALVGIGSAYFHGTLTYFGQMADELPMVYSMIVWWFILFRMNKASLKSKISSIDILLISGIFYGFLWTYIHSLKTFVVIFQLHFTVMILVGIVKLIRIYRQIQYHTRSIMYLIMGYLGSLILATICWIIDQQLCERMNGVNGFNPQLHAWWHVFIALNVHMSVVCAEAMRVLSIKYQQHQMKVTKSLQQPFKSEDHLHIVFHCGLPFVDYSKHKQNNEIKNE